jgi:hypothetical protein
MGTANQGTKIDTMDSTNRSVYKVGFWSALIASVGACGYSIVQILQIVGVIRKPMDGILIFGFSLLIAVPFMLAMLALHYATPTERRFWTHAALLLTVVYVVYVTLNYVVQLAVVIPALQPRTSLDLLDQTPHSLCWTLDALGYIFMGLAMLFAFPIFEKQGLQNWLRWFFLANGLMTPVIAVIYFYPTFSTTLLLFGLPWIITAPGSILLLTAFFKTKL